MPSPASVARSPSATWPPTGDAPTGDAPTAYIAASAASEASAQTSAPWIIRLTRLGVGAKRLAMAPPANSAITGAIELHTPTPTPSPASVPGASGSIVVSPTPMPNRWSTSHRAAVTKPPATTALQGAIDVVRYASSLRIGTIAPVLVRFWFAMARRSATPRPPAPTAAPTSAIARHLPARSEVGRSRG